jgi:hypothetical protein
MQNEQPLEGTIGRNGKKRRAVIITTQHRGVFFGYLASKVDKGRLSIARARNVLYFDTATKGFLGLASTGPTNGCRIGPSVLGKSTLFDITGVFEVSDEAVKRFEDAPWSR